MARGARGALQSAPPVIAAKCREEEMEMGVDGGPRKPHGRDRKEMKALPRPALSWPACSQSVFLARPLPLAGS